MAREYDGFDLLMTALNVGAAVVNISSATDRAERERLERERERERRRCDRLPSLDRLSSISMDNIHLEHNQRMEALRLKAQQDRVDHCERMAKIQLVSERVAAQKRILAMCERGDISATQTAEMLRLL